MIHKKKNKTDFAECGCNTWINNKNERVILKSIINITEDNEKVTCKRCLDRIAQTSNNGLKNDVQDEN